MEAEGYPHTSRTEENSTVECFISVSVVLERRCIDEGYYLCLFGDYNDCAVPWEENIDCIGLRPHEWVHPVLQAPEGAIGSRVYP